jgi:ECF sigma factor
VYLTVNQTHSHPVSELLVRWKVGDQQALEDLAPLVYKELRDIARHHLRRERTGHTLQSAALVHEAYLRLVDQRPSMLRIGPISWRWHRA